MTAEGAAFGTGPYETYDDARAVSLYCDYPGAFHNRRGSTYLCEIVPYSVARPLNVQATDLYYGVVPEPDESTRATYLKVAPPTSKKLVREVPGVAPWAVGEDIGRIEAEYRRALKYAEVSAKVYDDMPRHKDGDTYIRYTGENRLGLTPEQYQKNGDIMTLFEIGLDFARYITAETGKGLALTPFEPIDWRLQLNCPCGRRYRMTREKALDTYRKALDNGIRGVPVRLCATAF